MFKPLLKKYGEIRIVSIAIVCAAIASVMRVMPSPISKILVVVSTLFNQIAIAFTDSPYILFASMFSTPRTRGKLLGIF